MQAILTKLLHGYLISLEMLVAEVINIIKSSFAQNIVGCICIYGQY